MQPKIDSYLLTHPQLKLVTQFGLQVRHVSELNGSKHIYVYKNCTFNDQDGYGDIRTLRDAGFTYQADILNAVNSSKFTNAGAPELSLIADGNQRLEALQLYLTATINFHRNNAGAALWGQGAVWASLQFKKFVKHDHGFPIPYLVSLEHSVGKTSAFIAYAKSIGLSEESMGGNKTSESGFLDWVSTYSCLTYFIDDFNPRKCVNRKQDTWMDLFKQLFDAKTVHQHAKTRLILSGVVVSANAEMPPDMPTQSRLLMLYFTKNDNSDLASVKQWREQYADTLEFVSCLVPDIVALQWKGDLDMRHINELEQLVIACAPDNIAYRVAQNMKKPMYYLVLTFKMASLSTDHYDLYIFDYMQTMIRQYNSTCSQVDAWSKFFYYLARTLEVHNRKSNKSDDSLDW